MLGKRHRARLPLLAAAAAAAAAAAGLGAWALAARPLDTDAGRQPAPRGRWTEVVGAVHVHTTHSDGAGSVDHVTAAARRAGLDFVVVTDHNTFGAKPAEGYADDLLLMVGTEISTHAGHLLALGIDEPSYRFPPTAPDVLRDVAQLGGTAIVAHPTSPRDDLRWKAEELPGGWGLEVFNGDTQWRLAPPLGLLSSLFVYPLRSRHALARLLTRPAALELWDELLSRRHAAGIAGADAHTRLPSYESVLGVARNHLVLDAPLTGDAARDGGAIVDALARGRLFVGIDGMAATDGFFFVAERGGRTWTMGDTTGPHPALTLRAGGTDAAGARFSLLKDGAVLATGSGALEAPAAGSGVYRVEVSLPGWDAPWILSNPIYVFDDAESRRRRAHAALAPPSPAVVPAAYLDRFENESIFATASDPTSSITLATEPRGGGADGAAARVAYRLGARTRATPSPYVAVTSFAPRDLSSYDGLTLAVRADGVYRLWIQVRDRNPRSSEGTEWWSASVKATPEWQRLTVPFSRLRSRDPATDGRLDLDEVEAVIFIVDADAVPAGTAGTLWFDDAGLYRRPEGEEQRP